MIGKGKVLISLGRAFLKIYSTSHTTLSFKKKNKNRDTEKKKEKSGQKNKTKKHLKNAHKKQKLRKQEKRKKITFSSHQIFLNDFHM